MNLEILKFVPATQKDFVSFWSSQYKYNLEHLYDRNIGKPLTQDRVWSLYKWKNGTEKIAAKKQESIRNVYLPQLKSLPILSTIEDGKYYIQSLNGGAIWDIFWLHCVNPKVFPIFDQHTYRSMAKIEGLNPAEIPPYRPNKLKAYFGAYVPFTQKFSGFSERTLDKALFAYGRFLKKGLSGK